MSQVVLCIEDNVDNAMILDSILRRDGFTVCGAWDYNSAMEIAKDQQLDLIICDFHLPGENAPEVIASLREFDHLRDTPVIILTANTQNIAESQAIGISAYLNKPIKPLDLLNAINDVMP